MNAAEKKSFEKPKLTVHGALETITQAGGAPNADTFQGPDDTAFSPA